MTIKRPFGAAGRAGGTHSAGCAAAMAASNILRSSVRAALSAMALMLRP
jgi:hypothetical protein